MIKRVAAAAVVVVLLGLLGVAPAVAAEERSLSLSASTFSFAAEPGQKGSGEVTVINDGTVPVSVRVYVADQVIAADGSASFVVPGPTSNRLTGSASWLTFQLPPEAKAVGNIPYIEMPVGAQLPVKFEVVIPDGAPPGDRQAILFFEMFSPEKESDASVAHVDARIGTRVQTRVKGEVVEKVEVRPFTMPSFVMGSLPDYAFTMRNVGNVDEIIDARLVVLDRSENEVASTEVLKSTPLYASTSLEKKGVLQLKGLGLGPHHVRLTVSFRGESGVANSVEKDRTVWAVPVWVLVAFATLVVMLLFAGVWVAATRAAAGRLRDRANADANDEKPSRAG